jgi:hypothetical protein
LEGTADLTLVSKGKTELQGSNMELAIKNFKWFDRLVSDTTQRISFVASRQGRVADVSAHGYMANWLSAEVSSIVALSPVDGIKPGDSWEMSEWMRIPALQATNIPPLKKINLKVRYVRDEEINGQKCRLYRTADELWLNEIGVKVEDFLPTEDVNRVGGSFYKYFNDRGGKFLFKREQWVNAETWVQDIRRPVAASNADKDNDMIMSLAQTVLIQQK